MASWSDLSQNERDKRVREYHEFRLRYYGAPLPDWLPRTPREPANRVANAGDAGPETK